MAKVPVIFANQELSGEQLSSDEKRMLLDHVYNYLAWNNSFLLDLFKLNEEAIIGAASVAKDKFDAKFGGVLAGDSQFGVQLIRPGHILRTTGATETPQNDWTFSLTADSDYWVGYSTNNTTAAHVDKENCLLFLGIQFTQGSQPTVEELYWKIGATDYIITVIRGAWAADNPNRIRAARFHPMLADPKQTVLVQTYSILAASQEPVLLGLAFGLGRFLRTQEYSAVSL